MNEPLNEYMAVPALHLMYVWGPHQQQVRIPRPPRPPCRKCQTPFERFAFCGWCCPKCGAINRLEPKTQQS